MATIRLNWGSTGVYERQSSNVSTRQNDGWVSTKVKSKNSSYRRMTINLAEVFGSADVVINSVYLTAQVKESYDNVNSNRGHYRVYVTDASMTAVQAINNQHCLKTSYITYVNDVTSYVHKFTWNGATCIEVAPNLYCYFAGQSSSSTETLTATGVFVDIDYTPIKGYVSFDSVFSYKKWKDAGITGANHLTISNISDTGFSATAGGSDSYTADSPIFQLTAGTTYVMAYDTTGGSSRECFVFYHSSASAGWNSFTNNTANSFEFTPPSGYPYISIRVDVNNSGETINYSNFRIYPKGHDYMSASVSAADRTKYDSWSLPTPTRTGYNFDAWYTGLNGTGTKYTASSSQPTTDTVLYSNWSIKTFQITSSAGTGGSITASATVNYGSSKTFTITPNTGYNISDVKVDGVSVGAVSSYTFSNVTATHTIAATFVKKTYRITTQAGTGGSISPSNPDVEHGTNKSFSIVPINGYQITDVKVDGVSQGAISSYTFSNVTATHTISATFALATFTITATAGTGGSISPASATVDYGGSQTFTITPSTGYVIFGVRVDGVNQGAISSYTFSNVTASHTIEATFVSATYVITATAGTGGSVSPASATVTHGGDQTFTFTPNTGYQVSDVLVDGTSVGAVSSYTFTNVTATHTISAMFSLLSFAITVTQPTNGSISPSSATVYYGGSQSFTITPDTGYEIDKLTIDGTDIAPTDPSGDTYTFSNVTSAHTITATMVRSSTEPTFISITLQYNNNKISASNKVPTGESFLVSIQITES